MNTEDSAGTESEVHHVPHQPWSLAARLGIWYGLGALCVLVFTTILLYYGLVRSLNHEDDIDLMTKVSVLEARMKNKRDPLSVLIREIGRTQDPAMIEAIPVRLLTDQGQVLVEAPLISRVLPAAVFPGSSGFPSQRIRGINFEASSGRPFRLGTFQIHPDPSLDRTYEIQVALDRSSEVRLLTMYRRWLLGSLATGWMVFIIVGYAIARRGLFPIHQMAETIRQISSTNLQNRLTSNELPRELSSLAVTFNKTMDRIEDAFVRLSQFSANLAHELRTPITNLRGEAEVALQRTRTEYEYREVLESSLEEYQRLSRLIDNLLFLARAEEAQTPLSPQRINVGMELATLKDYYEVVADEADLIVESVAPAGLVASLDRSLFQRAIGNLIENAIAHTPPGGAIRLAAGLFDNRVHIEVRDTGEGISTTHLPYVFDRLYLAEPSRSRNNHNLGLGLAIVKSIVSLHGGEVRISSEPGRGTCVTLVFPSGT